MSRFSSWQRPAARNAQAGVFQLQKSGLSVNTAGIAGQPAAGTDDPVAGDEDGNFIASDRAAHRLGGHMGKLLSLSQLLRQCTIGRGLPVWDLQKQFPYRSLKLGTDGVQRRHKVRLSSGEVNIQPAFGR